NPGVVQPRFSHGKITNLIEVLVIFIKGEFMPALESKVIKDLTSRLDTYLARRGGHSTSTYLTSGGSAAVFK
ncbi:hypothetical protein, partial [Agathobacter rectalis]|uniref:hypothetical protein n=1 Tax=Agathobacter rectalis TaxID=39491 RepID=UPI0027D21875